MDSTQIIFQIISSLISIGGATMGFIAYRRSGSMKALDLRIELQKQLQILRQAVDGLPMLITDAQRSRTNVVSTGRGGGKGALMGWTTQADIDRKGASDLQTEIPPEDTKLSKLSVVELEQKMIEVHSLNLRANAIANRYRASLAADDVTRDQIAADMRAHMGGR
jgi:hypothetical protein